MSYPTLNALPDSTGYKVVYPNSIVSSGKLDGGASRGRADLVGATGQVDVQWSCAAARHNYIQAFFRTTVTNGVDPFYIDLIYDTSSIATYLAKFVPGTFSLDSQVGMNYVLKASLEVYPTDVDTNGDASMVAVYNAYGDNAGYVLGLLDILCNVSITV